jgi:pantoate--beta-alanine ligase
MWTSFAPRTRGRSSEQSNTPVQVVQTIRDYHAARAALSGPVGLFPTLGGVHNGHLALVDRARSECANVVGWLFLNPTQFGHNEDLDQYPHDQKLDLSLLEAHGVDLLLIPPLEEIYPDGFDTLVHVGGITERLEGARRPGHFDGVTTIVLKLLNIMQPDRAYFGEKDAQQLRVVRQLVRDLNLPMEIVACPTVRDLDGLALSSRNAYLSDEERADALALSRGLRLAQEAFASGQRDADTLRSTVRTELESAPLVLIDYVSLANNETLEELSGEIRPPALLSLAAHVGTTHLIDNITLHNR